MLDQQHEVLFFSVHVVEWRERFDELKQYKSVHNHCNVPRKEGGVGLGNLVDYQRTAFRGNKLSDEQKEIFNKVMFI